MSKIKRRDAEMISILKEAENGGPFPDLCRTYGRGRAMFYKWRSRYERMYVDAQRHRQVNLEKR